MGAPATPRPQQEPPIDTVLDRASAYIAEFKRQLSGIVAEEEYVQELVATLPDKKDRTVLKSDLLLVRPANASGYVGYRDVFEVDGRPVRDRANRLTRLFLDPRASATQLQRILAESARYNLGREYRVQRNINTPTLALQFLDAANRRRFAFRRSATPTARLDSPDRVAPADNPRFSLSVDVWIVDYHEILGQTLIRTPRGQDSPASGRFWIEPESGRVLMTELLLLDPDLKTTIYVDYKSEPSLGLLVPWLMRERYERQNLRIQGTATYRGFRRFDVAVDERLLTPLR